MTFTFVCKIKTLDRSGIYRLESVGILHPPRQMADYIRRAFYIEAASALQLFRPPMTPLVTAIIN
jgi:hypothetical protein